MLHVCIAHLFTGRCGWRVHVVHVHLVKCIVAHAIHIKICRFSRVHVRCNVEIKAVNKLSRQSAKYDFMCVITMAMSKRSRPRRGFGDGNSSVSDRGRTVTFHSQPT